MANIYELIITIKNELINYQNNIARDFDVEEFENNVKKKVNILEIQRENLEFENILNPLNETREQLSVEWLAGVIAAQMLDYKLTYQQINLVLKTITYYGFYGLFHFFNKVKVDLIDNDMEKFAYHKVMAKYYKEKGDFENAKKSYLNVIESSKKINFQPYAFILYSKFCSDFLQRNGLCIEYSRIAYNRLKSQLGHKNCFDSKITICLDTFAKEIRNTDRKQSDRIYKILLRPNKILSPLNLQRIKFRLLEMNIRESIESMNIVQLTKQLMQYEDNIVHIYKNPKAEYIRKIVFISLMRIVKEKIIMPGQWIELRIRQLVDGEAEAILNRCIEEAKQFRDRKTISTAYYEKSFWCRGGDEMDKTKKSIEALKEGLSLFSDDKKTILNKIYVNLLFRLVELYEKINRLDDALDYCQKLYDYIHFLTKELEKDKKDIDEYIYLKRRKKEAFQDKSELDALNGPELRAIKSSLITDYENLIKLSLSLNNRIGGLQKKIMNHFERIQQKQKKIINHDLRGCLKLISDNAESLKIADNVGDIAVIDRIKEGIKGAEKIVDETLKSTFEKYIYPDEIFDLNLIVEDYLQSYQHDEAIEIQFNSEKRISAKIPSEIIYRLLYNLIENSKIVAVRNKITPVKIRISFDDAPDMISLFYYDNVGEYDYFQKVITNLNIGKKVLSRRDTKQGGKGLVNLKDIFKYHNGNKKWILEGNDFEKKLIIPIIMKIHE